MAAVKQYEYSFGDFLRLSETSKERMEYINGEIVYPAAPNTKHQNIVLGMGSIIWSYIRQNKGKGLPFGTNDYHKKLVLYKEHGVREYWIVDPKDAPVQLSVCIGEVL